MPGYLVGQLLGVDQYRQRSTTLVLSAKDTIYRAIIALLTVTAIIWVSIFLYATWYYSYMPLISHARPVHLQFSRSCEKTKDDGMCTFPTANVTLTKRQQLLMVGQPYKILIEMEMPESPANQNLGMFLVCAHLIGKDRVHVDTSCRSAMLHYKSYLHHTLSTFFFSPFLLSGSAEEKQLVQVELFSNFEENPSHPVTDALIEIQSQHVEIYQTRLKIHAHFTGLRYMMFHWPVLSAVIGISTNLFFLTIIAILSWFKFFTPKQITYPAGYDPQKVPNSQKSLEERRTLAKQRLMKERGKLLNQRVILPGTGPSSGVLTTNKEHLNSASEPVMEPPKEQEKDLEKGSESDNESLNEKAETIAKTSDRRSSDEFVVVPDPIPTDTDKKDAQEYYESSQEPDLEKQDEKKENLDEDKENQPYVADDTVPEEPDVETTLRHRTSQQIKDD